MPRRLLLPKHVHVCKSGQHFVLLDLKSDRYLAFDERAGCALSALVKGWPQTPATANDDLGAAAERASALAKQMLARGLLTKDPHAAATATAHPLDPISTVLVEEDPETHSPIRVSEIGTFLAASIVAASILRWRSIDRVVARVRRRKRRHSAGIAPLDVEQARRLVTVFESLRPFLFTSRDACLFHALALIEFLAHYRLFPTWVFGVRTAPFAAHCWVQHDTVLFNDDPTNVRSYTPIMTV